MPEVSQSTRLIRSEAVRAKTSLSRSTIWRLIRAGDFPPPVKLSANRVAWPEEAVNAWINARAEAA